MFLSQEGKYVLIKSNLVGIPQFTMQGIKISNFIAKKWIRKTGIFSSRVTWTQATIMPIAPGFLDRVCRPKCKGGVGIRKFQNVNAANLAKLGWEVLSRPKNL